jgi:hypothetical protein
MQTLRDIAPYVAPAGAALSLVLLVLVLVLWSRVRRLRRAQTVILGREERDVVAYVENLDSQVRNLREAVEILTDELDDQKRHLDRALTNRAIVRYDAFRDAGGEQSASFALLDQYRSGVVFSAIAARDFARIYVKHLSEGVADRDLSPEEAQVVAAAVPRPLSAGEDGQRAARAPKAPGDAPPRDLPATGAPVGRADEGAPPRIQGQPTASATAAAPAPHDTADMPAIPARPGAIAAPGGEPQPGTVVRPPAAPYGDDTTEFTWEPPPARGADADDTPVE